MRERAKHSNADGDSDDERQAAGERVDLVLLVELEQLLVLLLLVVLVLLLDLLDLRLHALHRDHRARLLRGEREEDEHHRAGEQDDADPQVGDERIEEVLKIVMRRRIYKKCS